MESYGFRNVEPNYDVKSRVKSYILYNERFSDDDRKELLSRLFDFYPEFKVGNRFKNTATGVEEPIPIPDDISAVTENVAQLDTFLKKQDDFLLDYITVKKLYGRLQTFAQINSNPKLNFWIEDKFKTLDFNPSS